MRGITGNLLEQSANGRVASLELMIANQGLVDGGRLNAFRLPNAKLILVWFGKGILLRKTALALKSNSQNTVFREGFMRTQPVMALGNTPDFSGLDPADKPGFGELAV